MKFRVVVAVVSALMFSGSAAAQLTCSTSGSEQCDALHYHVQAWSPEIKQYVEIYGQNTFSTIEACENAKKEEAAIDAAAVAHLKTAAPRLKTPPSKFGACHCDMTTTKSHANFLDEERRFAMMRRDRELKLAMAKLLLEHDATVDQETVRAYFSGSSALSTAAPYWPGQLRFVELKGNKLLDSSKTRLQETSITTTRASGVVGSSIELAAVNLDPQLFASETSTGATDAASREIAFLTAEMNRMSALLQKVAESSDGEAEHLLELCNERIQVLTNLGKVAESGGDRSLLASAMKNAADEPDRVKLIQLLFGPLVAHHWAPSDPAAMKFSVPQAIETDPVAVLRDSSGRFTEDERKVALFSLMASNSALTETEEIWLAGIFDTALAQ